MEDDATGIVETGTVTGKRVFGGAKEKKVALPAKKRKLNDDQSSDSNSDAEDEETIVDERIDDRPKKVNVSYSLLNEDAESHQEPLIVVCIYLCLVFCFLCFHSGF